MNRNTTSRVAVPARPVRATALRSNPARSQPRRRGVVGRIFRWLVFLSLVGAVVASFFVKAPDGQTYADLYTMPAYRWAKDKIFPPEEEPETAKKEAAPAAPSELDVKFDEAVAGREKAAAAKPPEATEEAVSFLEKALEAAGKRIDAVREIGLEASKGAAKKARVGAAQVVEELAAQARVQKEIAAGLAKYKSAFDVKAALAAVPPPPPPPAPAPPPPAPVFYDLKMLQAWPAQPVGTWVRWKKTAGDRVSYEDHILAALTEEAAAVRIEAVPGPQATGERVFAFGADSARVVREESVKIGDTEVPCRVVQSGSTLRWIPKEGPAADRVAIKTQTGDRTAVCTELGEEEMPVKGEAKKCLKVTIGDVTTWGHCDVPGFVARVKSGGETAEAIDWGADPAARPATQKPVEELPEKALLAEAEWLKIHGWLLLQEVIETMKTPTTEPGTLKTSYLNLESASALLTKSREVFLKAREKAADPTSIDETVSILGRLLELTARHTESFKSRLK